MQVREFQDVASVPEPRSNRIRFTALGLSFLK
jgi:hypothetical protein